MASETNYTLIRTTRRYIQRVGAGRPKTTSSDTIPTGSELEFPETGEQEIYDGERWVRKAFRTDPRIDELIAVMIEVRDLLVEIHENQ